MGSQPKQAQDTSAALSDTFTEWLSVGNVVTREDLQGLREGIQKDMQKLDTAIAETKAEVRQLKADFVATLSETKAEIMKWMFGQTVVLLAALYGLIHTVGKF